MVAIKMNSCLLSVLFVNVFYGFVSSLYFYIGETEKKCFIEDIPDEINMIVGNYRMQLYDEQDEEYLPAIQGLGMFVEVTDPAGQVIQQHSSEGYFIFSSHTPGEHRICLQSNHTKFALFARGVLRVRLGIHVGEHTNNDAEIAAKDKLTELQLRVRQLVEQVDQIQKEQNYHKYREEHFRETSKDTNQWLLMSALQTVILVVIGFWQMIHLKSLQYNESEKSAMFIDIKPQVNYS